MAGLFLSGETEREDPVVYGERTGVISVTKGTDRKDRSVAGQGSGETTWGVNYVCSRTNFVFRKSLMDIFILPLTTLAFLLK